MTLYKPRNMVGSTIISGSNFVHGTDSQINLADAGDFASEGGYIRIDDGSQWALYEYTGVSSDTLTGLSLADYIAESTSSHTFEEGALVTLEATADLWRDIVSILRGDMAWALQKFSNITGVDTLKSDIATNLSAGIPDRICFEEDTGRVLYDDGTNFVELGLSESEISLANLASRAHGDLSDAPVNAHIGNLTDIPTRNHNDTQNISSDDHHSKTISSEIDHDSTQGGTDSDAHHSRYGNSEAITAINTDTDHGSDAPHNYFSGSYTNLTDTPDLSVLNDVVVEASQGDFPATGNDDKVYIANDTGYMYRWNGSSYTQLTDQTAIWGQISGTLSDQSDLQNVLANKLETVGTADLDFDTATQAELDTHDSDGDAHHIRYTDSEASSAVSAYDVGLGSVENIALSNADWSDIGIATTDVTKSDVGLGSVPNTDIAYASAIPADDFTSTEVTNLKSDILADGSTPWTSNNYYDDSDAIAACDGVIDADYADDAGDANTLDGYDSSDFLLDHNRYTDSEAISAVESQEIDNRSYEMLTDDLYIDDQGEWVYTHMNNSDAHHNRYSDGEAVNAVDGSDVSVGYADSAGDADTLDGHHDHEFLLDHNRYTDGEAQGACDGVIDSESVDGYDIQKDGAGGTGIINFLTS